MENFEDTKFIQIDDSKDLNIEDILNDNESKQKNNKEN